MIDYDKYKHAHELILKTNLWLEHEFGAGSEFDGKYWSHFRIILDGGKVLYEDSSLDFIIEKIKELTQPKPKYEIGQEVWFYTTRRGICNVLIEEIDNDSIEKYLYGATWYKEDELYPTKQDLIEAQARYWIGLMKECDPGFVRIWDMNPPFEGEVKGFNNKECQHENDGVLLLSNPPKFKCKKCAEFYR